MGIVGILTAQPTQLPVICFVVNAEPQGDMTGRTAGHKSPSVLGVSVCACVYA